MKGIYLAACLARHPKYDLDYNDIDDKFGCNIICDMMQVDLSKYDYIIASPPCNYYSRANYRRDTSDYALSTRHLLPSILEKLGKQNKPFLVENVKNKKLMAKCGIFKICDKYNIFVYFVGRHTYFTNQFVNLSCKQKIDYVAKGSYYSTNPNNYRQGGENVHNVIEIWLEYIHQKENKL